MNEASDESLNEWMKHSRQESLLSIRTFPTLGMLEMTYLKSDVIHCLTQREHFLNGTWKYLWLDNITGNSFSVVNSLLEWSLHTVKKKMKPKRSCYAMLIELNFTGNYILYTWYTIFIFIFLLSHFPAWLHCIAICLIHSVVHNKCPASEILLLRSSAIN